MTSFLAATVPSTPSTLTSTPGAIWAALLPLQPSLLDVWDDRADRQCGLLLHAAHRAGSQSREAFRVIKKNYVPARLSALLTFFYFEFFQVTLFHLDRSIDAICLLWFSHAILIVDSSMNADQFLENEGKRKAYYLFV